MSTKDHQSAEAQAARRAAEERATRAEAELKRLRVELAYLQHRT